MVYSQASSEYASSSKYGKTMGTGFGTPELDIICSQWIVDLTTVLTK